LGLNFFQARKKNQKKSPQKKKYMSAVKSAQKRGRRTALSPLAEDVADQPATKTHVGSRRAGGVAKGDELNESKSRPTSPGDIFRLIFENGPDGVSPRDGTQAAAGGASPQTQPRNVGGTSPRPPDGRGDAEVGSAGSLCKRQLSSFREFLK
jgi:hypothetical protein